MKIIYDSEADALNRVVMIGHNGESSLIPCYDIKIDDGKTAVVNMSRWGSAKERQHIAEAFRRVEKEKSA